MTEYRRLRRLTLTKPLPPEADDHPSRVSERVTARIVRTSDGEIVTEYQLAGLTYSSLAELEAELRSQENGELVETTADCARIEVQGRSHQP